MVLSKSVLFLAGVAELLRILGGKCLYGVVHVGSFFNWGS